MFVSVATCHVSSPSCNDPMPVFNLIFPQCCAMNTGDATQTSYLNSDGECVNCGTVGKHLNTPDQ